MIAPPFRSRPSWIRNLDVFIGFAQTQFQQHLAYPGDFWMSPLARLGIAAALVGFWNAVYETGAAPGGMTRDMMLAWAAASIVMSRLVNVDLAEQIAERIRRGDIVFEVMRPANYQAQAFGSWIGSSLYKILVDTTPMALVLWGIAGVSGPPNPQALLLALLSLLLAMIIAFLLHFSVILIGFWTIHVRTWTWLLDRVVQFTAGFFVPLWLLPDGLQNVLQYLPFAMLYHVPLSIFVGRVEHAEILRLLVMQIIWIPILVAVGRFMTTQARRRMLIQGG